MTCKVKTLALGLFLWSAMVGAQTTTPATPTTTTCIDLSAKPAADKPRKRGGLMETAGRMAGLADAQATTDQNICPLSGGKKFEVWLHKSYSPLNVVAAAFDAAIWQATEPASEGGYGQGWDAYGSRFGASLANTESGRFFQTFFFPALLHEDPRYFREANGPLSRRCGYALSRVLVARTDSGNHRFNYSEVIGAFMAAGLTNAYYPDPERTAGRTMRAAGLSLATSAGWNVLYEFGPDILRKLRGKPRN